jgi:hypothetical protein
VLRDPATAPISAELRETLAFLFAVYDRLADSMGWEQLDERERAGAAQRLHRNGYA